MASKRLKLDIACGQNKQDGWTGIDIAEADGVDIVHDLLVTPWPLKDGSVYEAHCSHFVEHLPHDVGQGRDGFFVFFDELYRVLRKGGKCVVIVPHGRSDRGLQDPTHQRYVVAESFLYLSREWREQNRLDHYPVSCDFFADPIGYAEHPYFGGRTDEHRTLGQMFAWNYALDMHVTLTKR